jgi:hypothetical protein
MDINEIEYGNPINDILHYLNTESYLDALFQQLAVSAFSFPENDSNNTRSELNDLVQKVLILQTGEDTKILERYFRYDQSLINFYNAVRFDSKEEAEEYQKILIGVFNDVLPLIFKLKFHYQRPRPFQLANYHKLKLFPFHSYSADSPAYPSLHACMAHVLAVVMANRYPTAAKYFRDVANDISISRQYLGVNYKSSMDAGILVAGKVLDNDEFVSKYKK